MSNIPDRLYKISKAYLDQVRDRIDSELTEREHAVAEQELRSRGEDASLPSFAANNGGSSGPNEFRAADDMMRRAEERIAAARRERESRESLSRDAGSSAPAPVSKAGSAAPAAAAATNAGTSDDPNASDYRVLGVPVGSDLATVLSAYEKLSRRCDPRRFPDGSAEQNEAARILVRVNASYENLHKRLDPTENRFGKLEL